MAKEEEQRGSDGKLERYKPEERFVADPEMIGVTKGPRETDEPRDDDEGSGEKLKASNKADRFCVDSESFIITKPPPGSPRGR